METKLKHYTIQIHILFHTDLGSFREVQSHPTHTRTFDGDLMHYRNSDIFTG